MKAWQKWVDRLLTLAFGIFEVLVYSSVIIGIYGL